MRRRAPTRCSSRSNARRLKRQAADAQLRLLTAQIEPHFLLNTLANVQQLVDSGSPRAAPVFRSLIDYLRAALPQLHQKNATLGDEERLVRAYLELMHDAHAGPAHVHDRTSSPSLRALPFPPMALLTLVENAIRHGIDPGCDGGRVEVGARRGAAQARSNCGSRTPVLGLHGRRGHRAPGCANLQERLQAYSRPAPACTLSGQAPHGVRADIRVTPAADA